VKVFTSLRHRRACRLYRQVLSEWQVGRRSIPRSWQAEHPVELGRVRRTFIRDWLSWNRPVYPLKGGSKPPPAMRQPPPPPPPRRAVT